MRHLVTLVEDLEDRGIALKVLAGQGASIDTTTAGGKLIFGTFAARAEFEAARRVPLPGFGRATFDADARCRQSSKGQATDVRQDPTYALSVYDLD